MFVVHRYLPTSRRPVNHETFGPYSTKEEAIAAFPRIAAHIAVQMGEPADALTTSTDHSRWHDAMADLEEVDVEFAGYVVDLRGDEEGDIDSAFVLEQITAP
jgi:hypothetical protein